MYEQFRRTNQQYVTTSIDTKVANLNCRKTDSFWK